MGRLNKFPIYVFRMKQLTCPVIVIGKGETHIIVAGNWYLEASLFLLASLVGRAFWEGIVLAEKFGDLFGQLANFVDSLDYDHIIA